MATTLLKPVYISIFIILISTFPLRALSVVDEDCLAESGDCINKSRAQNLKIVAIFAILVTSMIGIGLPLLTRSIPALNPENNIFIVVKAFASGIILATGFMHVLPDSFNMLGSSCLSEKPWHKFPFSGFLAMFSAIFTLMVDSLTTSFYTKKNSIGVLPETQMTVRNDQESGMHGDHHHVHAHGHSHGLSLATKEGLMGPQLLRYKVIAMVLEMGIIVHSVVIGLGMGASNNTCTLKPLVAAMCFHQMFEGMGLGGCILQAEYNFAKKLAMAFFFAVTTPFGIAIGLALQSSYRENSPTALITVGLLNASSAGLLIYMALVDLLAADFMGSKLQGSIKLQLKCFVAVFLGASGMSIMALWA